MVRSWWDLERYHKNLKSILLNEISTWVYGYVGQKMTEVFEIVDTVHTIFKEPSGIFQRILLFLTILLRNVETSLRISLLRFLQILDRFSWILTLIFKDPWRTWQESSKILEGSWWGSSKMLMKIFKGPLWSWQSIFKDLGKKS